MRLFSSYLVGAAAMALSCSCSAAFASPLFGSAAVGIQPSESDAVSTALNSVPALAEHLDEQGQLRLPVGYVGKLDVTGLRLVSAPGEGPRFVAKGDASVADQRWAQDYYSDFGCGPILAAVVNPAGQVFLGGTFARCGEVEANNIVLYDPDTRSWTALGNGGNGVDAGVHSLVLDGTDLYVGGAFDLVNVGAEIAARHVARWDGQNWFALASSDGEGVSGTVRALAMQAGNLYVAGDFSQANIGAPVVANGVAVWDGANWSGVGSGAGNGLNGPAYALIVDGTGFYVGGEFSEANVGAPVAANNIAHWNGSQWSAVGSGSGNGLDGLVYSLAYFDGELIAGGVFTQANVGDAVIASHVARWNGARWANLPGNGGEGTDSFVRKLHVFDGELFVGGDFSNVNVGAEQRARHVARWDGSVWAPVGGDSNGTDGLAVAFADDGERLYVGGYFTSAATVIAHSIALWEADQWSSLGSGGLGANGAVWAIEVVGDDLYIGGEFTAIAGVAANRVVRFDGTHWTPLGSQGGNGLSWDVRALAAMDGDLYVGGHFLNANVGSADGVTTHATYIAKWDGTQWSGVGANGGFGVNNWVQDLAVYQGALYAAGFFSQANYPVNQVPTFGIARWTGDEWQSVGSDSGNGIDGVALALEVLDEDLYVGGSFTQANVNAPIAANHLARWDGSSWSAVGSNGNGLNATVNALVAHQGELYVGGDFTAANVGAEIDANYIASWDGIAWKSVGIDGNGVDHQVFALESDGDALYVGGNFTTANVGVPVAVNLIARWDGSRWTALGSGLSSFPWVIRATANKEVLVGGRFGSAGGHISRNLARYRTAGTLTLSVIGDGLGQVVSSPAGIDCSPDCTASFIWDQPIALGAMPAENSLFNGWSDPQCPSGPVCTFELIENRELSASFASVLFIDGFE